MRVAVIFTVSAVGLCLAACGQSATKSETQQAHAASSEQPAAAPATQAAEPSDADKAKVLAALPAPYNGADLANGKARFALCASCHTIAAGAPNMTGPNLHGVFGRKAGTLTGYNYSPALKTAGFAWDPQHLDGWIAQPRTFLPGTKMTFAGLKDPKDRTDLVAYVMVESGFQP